MHHALDVLLKESSQNNGILDQEGTIAITQPKHIVLKIRKVRPGKGNRPAKDSTMS